MPNSVAEITQREHDGSIGQLGGKRAGLYIWDSANLTWVRMLGNAAGRPQLDIVTLPSLVLAAGSAVIGKVDINTMAALVAGSAIIGKVDQNGTWTVQPGNTQNTTPWLVQQAFGERSDTYTADGNGTVIDMSTKPVCKFAIQAKGTGAAPTAWDVRLEGSLNNVNWTQVLQHTNLDNDGDVKWTTTDFPVLYMRSRMTGLVLGTATNMVVRILGMS